MESHSMRTRPMRYWFRVSGCRADRLQRDQLAQDGCSDESKEQDVSRRVQSRIADAQQKQQVCCAWPLAGQSQWDNESPRFPPVSDVQGLLSYRIGER